MLFLEAPMFLAASRLQKPRHKIRRHAPKPDVGFRFLRLRMTSSSEWSPAPTTMVGMNSTIAAHVDLLGD